MALLALLAIGILVGASAAIGVHRSAASDPTAPAIADDTIRTIVYRHPRLRHFFASRFDPAAATAAAIATTAIIFVLGASIIGVLALIARSGRGPGRIDPYMANWAARHVSTATIPTLRAITQFGGAVVLVPLAALVAVIEAVRARSRTVLAFVVLVVGGQFAVANTVKFLVGRARPAIRPLTGFSGRSFPSGHATAAAATFAAFAFLIGRRRTIRTRSILAGAAVAAAIVIGGTRVLLGVHWFIDVIAGMLLGWAWFAVCSFAFGGRLLRFGVPVAKAEAVAEIIEGHAGDANAPTLRTLIRRSG